MAIGMGRMMGFVFPENFDRPYAARSITEFWRRWHMTLSRWLRDYLYIPLGGNRLGARRTLGNLMIVMALGGLWHGAAWTFVAWGVWHGALLVLERVLGEQTRSRTFDHLRTLVLVSFGWIMFRAGSFPDAVALAGSCLGLTGVGFDLGIAVEITNGSLVAWAVGIAWIALERRLVRIRVPAMRVAVGALFGVSIIRVLAASYSPFLYFQF
jgi:alginate O-acetyltransferase complex protein AlgI